MSEQEIQDLLADLAERGFKDDHLRSDIERIEALGLPAFAIKREKVFGDEKMLYRLQFEWLESSLGFEFTAIHVNHRMPVDIDQKFVNGIDSLQLDQEMAAVNWAKYWELKLKVKPEDDFFDMGYNYIDSLVQMLLHESSDVNQVAEQLMYKHWPPEIFALFSKDPERISKTFEHRCSFPISANPDITAELAYLIISERMDALCMHVEDIGFKMIPESEIRNELYTKLKGNPQEALAQFSFYCESDYVTLNVALRSKDSWYQIESYNLNLVQLPDTVQGFFNGIDVERLDKKMATVDWKNDPDIQFATRNGVELPRDIDLLQEELFRLALVPGGQEAVDILTLRHWLCAPYFSELITSVAMVKLVSFPVKTAYFPAEIKIEKAINLLQGRPIWENDLEGNPAVGAWQRLAVPYETDPARIEDFQAISKKEVEKYLQVIPVLAIEKPDILNKLLEGRTAEAKAKSGAFITIELTEKLDGIKISDQNHREIPFNFHLDPDWKPVTDQRISIKGNQKEDQRSQVRNSPKIPSLKPKGKRL